MNQVYGNYRIASKEQIASYWDSRGLKNILIERILKEIMIASLSNLKEDIIMQIQECQRQTDSNSIEVYPKSNYEHALQV